MGWWKDMDKIITAMGKFIRLMGENSFVLSSSLLGRKQDLRPGG